MLFNSKNGSGRLVAAGIAAAMLITVVTACNIDYAGLSEGLNDLGNAVDIGNQTPATPASESTTEWTTSFASESSETTETEETSSETASTSESSSETTGMPSETTTETASETTTETTIESTAASATESATGTTASGSTWGTTETAPSESETTSETTTAPSESATETVPAPTAVPTKRPANTRVDFSELFTAKIGDSFEVDTEEFSESVDAEYKKSLAVFTGKRMVIGKAGSDNVAEAINLILDGFYKEAAGYFSRYSGEARASYKLSGNIDTVYRVIVDYDYSYNKRVLSVVMRYKVTGGNAVLARKEEYASFDMLTGQYLTLASVADDWAGLQNALKVKLAKNASIPKAAAITDLYVAAQQPGTQSATIEIYGKYGGKQFHTTGDMNEFAKYLNRYGKLVYGISENNGNTN